MTNASSNQRPDVLENVSTSQMEELELHYTSGDRPAWDRLAQSYGWSPEQTEAVWTWFGQRPSEEER